MLEFLLDLLFPKRSLLGAEGDWITDDERARMRLFPVRLHRELLRKRGVKSLDCLIAAGNEKTTPLLKKAIRTFKYGRIPEIGPELGKRIVAALPGLLALPENIGTPVVCPVPLHWSRKFQRGFNQAEILAAVVAKELGYPQQNLLRRNRPTGHQARRKRDERLTALQGAFSYVGESPAPACVLVIDDICTTGATLDACAKALKRAGAKHVIGLSAAHE